MRRSRQRAPPRPPRAPPRPSGLGRRRRWQGVAHRSAPGVAGHDGAGVRPVAVGGRLGHPDGRRPAWAGTSSAGGRCARTRSTGSPGHASSATPPCSSSANPGSANRRWCAGCAWGWRPSGTRTVVLGDLKPDYAELVAAMGGHVVSLGRGQGTLNPLDPGAAVAAAERLTGRRPARAAGRRPRPASQPAGRPDRPEPGRTAIRHRDGRAVDGPRDPRRAPRARRRRALRPGGRARGRPRAPAPGDPGPQRRGPLPRRRRPRRAVGAGSVRRRARGDLRPAHQRPDRPVRAGLHRHIGHQRGRREAPGGGAAGLLGRRLRGHRRRPRPGRRRPGTASATTSWCSTSCGGCCAPAKAWWTGSTR